MLIVDNCIISEDIADRHFCCNLALCQGQCCVEGDCGAPVDENEIPIMKAIYPKVRPYMTTKGREVVEAQGVVVDDNAGEPCTPLVDNRECAYTVWENGCALCAIEQAFRDGVIDFKKPISCHLYPLRLDCYDDFIAINYHQWDVCHGATSNTNGIPLYKYLKEPLIRRFGEQWYQELIEQVKLRSERIQHNK